MTWDGQNERRRYPSDHDRLTQLLILSQTQAKDIAEIKKDYKDHSEKDDKRFERINWFIAIGIGIISTLEFILKR